jgi:hypothetical protein
MKAMNVREEVIRRQQPRLKLREIVFPSVRQPILVFDILTKFFEKSPRPEDTG